MMSTNPRIIEFCKRWKARHPRLALLNAINNVFPQLDRCALPIDPYALAKLRGIWNVVEAEIETDGHIVSIEGGGYVVYLNKRHSESRRRFTLAHEIGHTFFFDLSVNSDEERNIDERESKPMRVDPEEEDLCNTAAREILMPRKQFSVMVNRSGFGAKGVLYLANCFRTSIRATALRLVEFCPYSVFVCAWQKNTSTGAFETLWVQGSASVRCRKNAKFSVTSDQPGYRVFEAGQNFRGREWISLGGPVDHYFIDAARLGEADGRFITTIVLDGAAENLIKFPQEKVETQPILQLSLY